MSGQSGGLDQLWCVPRSATGVAHAMNIETEDTISLFVDWENIPSGHKATAIYTASWIAPKADVHSQQRFFYMGHQGEINIDQAHRGYSLATDQAGFNSPNPLFMKFTPMQRPLLWTKRLWLPQHRSLPAGCPAGSRRSGPAGGFR